MAGHFWFAILRLKIYLNETVLYYFLLQESEWMQRFVCDVCQTNKVYLGFLHFSKETSVWRRQSNHLAITALKNITNNFTHLSKDFTVLQYISLNHKFLKFLKDCKTLLITLHILVETISTIHFFNIKSTKKDT